MCAKHHFTDCCVMGEMEMQALRQFQSSYRSQNKPFKPALVDFCDFVIKVLPGEKNNE